MLYFRRRKVYDKQNTIISKDLLKVRNHHKILFLKRKEKNLIISSDNQFLVERKTKSERSKNQLTMKTLHIPEEKKNEVRNSKR